MHWDYIECKIPEWAVNPIEYGDYCLDLSEEDVEDLEQFMKSLPEGGSFEYSDDSYFSNTPDFGLPCNVYDAMYHFQVKDSSHSNNK